MPAPLTTTPNPAPAAPAAPNTALFANPGESAADYEARVGALNAGSGSGFGTPSPAAPVTDLGSAQDEVAKNLGFNNYQDALTKLTATPTDSETDLYNAAYSSAGLGDLANTITSRQNDLNTATGNINDNPWLDESTRVGRTKNLTDLANADIKNYQDEYDTKLKSVQDLVTRETADQNNTTTANKAKLATLEAQAKDLAAQAATQQKTASAAPKTIKGSSGATYKWNPSTNSFDQILPDKGATPASSNTFQFTPKQLTALQSQGLDSNSANGILQDIQKGQSLEDIRQQMKASGLDPGLLDSIMFYVDPKNNTPSKSSSSSSGSGRTL